MTEPPTASTLAPRRSKRGRGAPPPAHLRVVFPGELGTTVVVCGEGLWTVMGRGSGADVRIDHPSVSRRHLAVSWSEAASAYEAADLDSRNGSWLDGAKLGKAERPLGEGSVLRIGDVLFVLERAPDPSLPDAGQVSLEAIPGTAASVRALRAAVARAGPDPSPVLLLGETGTGKEWIAGELHRLSGRGGALVSLNCGALSPELVESQLFGHVRGAFTGAGDAQPGLFRAAHRGTLFLDEIGELPLALQPKLLRALQEGEVLPVGASKGAKVNVRVVAATHRDLGALVEAGGFRRDLYARLAMWEISVPALRRRRVDLFGWIARLRARWCAQRPGAGRDPLRFDADAAEALLLSPFPTNLRGLDRLVHEIGALAGGGAPIALDQLPEWVHARPEHPSAPAAAAEAPEAGADSRRPLPSRAEFEAEFARLGGNVRALSRHYGRDRRQIYRWIESYGLRSRSR
jgi:transcriptional regulator with GAF, ATPase, and Fis domain